MSITHRAAVYIGGTWCPTESAARIEVVDPSNETVFGSIPAAGTDDVDLAARAAAAALPSWARLPPKERAEWLLRIADLMEQRSEEFAELVTREVGMPLAQSRAIQVGLALSDLRSAAEAVDAIVWEEWIGNSLVIREPIGVVGAITPWNYPLHQVTAKVGGALAAGCTIVVKPSEVTPLSAFLLAEVVDQVGLPCGVFNLVSGTGGGVGEALVTHPRIDMISFTGSTRAGRRISELAAARVKPVAMELGGKSAAVVLEDADLEQAVVGILPKCFQNSGQTCSALTRLLVPRSRMDEAAEIAAAAAAKYVPGDPFDADTTLGPLVSAAQLHRVQGYIWEGVAEGARLVCGGVERPGGVDHGYYISPTIFADVRSDMKIAQEEVFGPVLVIIGYEDEADAIRIANDSDFGLSGAVWSGDQERAIAVARQIRTGQVSVNGGPFNSRAPFGGVKQSGHGRELGRFGVEEFLTYKSLQTPL